MVDLVECRSEIEYPERPRAIFFHGKRLEIDHVLASWHTPEGKRFRVITQDENILNLEYNEASDEWSIQL
jgi:hypothetical protein